MSIFHSFWIMSIILSSLNQIIYQLRNLQQLYGLIAYWVNQKGRLGMFWPTLPFLVALSVYRSVG